MEELVPGCPEVFTTCTPATSPASAWVMLVTFFVAMFSEVTIFALPVNDFLRMVLYPVVTITSSSSFPGLRVTLKSSLLALSSMDVYPTKLTSMTASSATSMVKFPSKSVETPLLVPFSMTVAPGSGSPPSSSTVPLMERCAHPLNANSIKANDTSRFFFILLYIVNKRLKLSNSLLNPNGINLFHKKRESVWPSLLIYFFKKVMDDFQLTLLG